MNLSAYFSIIIAFAVGYLLGVFTGRLLKVVIGVLALAAFAIVLYYYFLR